MRKAVRYYLIVLILCCCPVFVNAQVSLQDLINDYVEATIKKQDATSCLSRLNMFYKQKKPKEQAEVRKTIYDTIAKMQEEGKNKETLALIDLYQFFAEPTDNDLPILYFIKGEICAQELNDSTALKNVIRDLQMINTKNASQTTEYISTLNGYLEDIRNYVPVIKRLKGVWVPLCSVVNYNKDEKIPDICDYDTPSYILKNSNDFSLRMEGVCGHKLRSSWKDSKKMNSQHVVELGKNRIYADWSTEKLNEPNPEMLSTMMNISGSVGDLLAHELFADMGNTLTDVGSSLFSSALSSLVSSAFAPSKEIFIVQCELEMINDYELIGILNTQKITIKADGSPKNERTTEEVLFTKWNNNEESYLKSALYEGYSFYPGEYYNEKDDYLNEKVYKKRIKKLSSYKKYFHMIKSARKFTFNGTEYCKPYVTFNNMQILKQMYRNEQKMKNEGLPLSKKYNSDRNHATLGCSYYDISMQLEKEKLKTGIYIEKVEDYSTAYLHGIKQGDVLLKIDGFEMNTPKQAVSYIESLEPFTTVNLEILRKGKVLKIPVELSYKIVTH